MIKEKANLSLSQTIKTLEVLYEELKEESLQPPSRSGLYKAHLKLMKNKVIPNPSNAILQFDGATYSNLYVKQKRSIISVCFGGNLIAFDEVEDKKATTIFPFLKKH